LSHFWLELNNKLVPSPFSREEEEEEEGSSHVVQTEVFDNAQQYQFIVGTIGKHIF